MEEVLIVYKKVQMKLEKKLQDEYIMVSYDEKPGIQAIGNTVADKNPTEKHGFIARDSEYKRLDADISKPFKSSNFLQVFDFRELFSPIN